MLIKRAASAKCFPGQILEETIKALSRRPLGVRISLASVQNRKCTWLDPGRSYRAVRQRSRSALDQNGRVQGRLRDHERRTFDSSDKLVPQNK